MPIQDAFNVRSNVLTHTIPSQLGSFVSLESYMYLNGQTGDGGFTACVPTELGKISKLETHFSLAANELTSSVPTQLGRLSSISYMFNLDNAFSRRSSIPTELGKLSNMQGYMMLASNKLCGDIPTQFQALSSQVSIGWQVSTGSLIRNQHLHGNNRSL